MDFSVLMTTYNGETNENLIESIGSIFDKQTRKPNQVVIVIDGPFSDDKKEVIEEYKKNYPDVFDLVYLEKNVGQSKASAEGIKYVKHELVARMDSDDISVPDRFEKQMAIFESNNEIDVVGGWIAEFETDPEHPHSYRRVEENHDDIVKQFRTRMPFNNVTVMFKVKALEAAGGYGRDTVNEDFSVFSHMWVNNARFYNIQQVLCNVRTGNGMVSRRKGMRIRSYLLLKMI